MSVVIACAVCACSSVERRQGPLQLSKGSGGWICLWVLRWQTRPTHARRALWHYGQGMSRTSGRESLALAFLGCLRCSTAAVLLSVVTSASTSDTSYQPVHLHRCACRPVYGEDPMSAVTGARTEEESSARSQLSGGKRTLNIGVIMLEACSILANC